MPGKASEFTIKTVMFINGKSGSGKTTLSSFLKGKRKNINIIHLDNYFTKKNLKYLESDKDYTKLIQDRTFKTYEHIGTICKKIVKEQSYINNVINYIIKEILHSFNKTHYKLLIIEVYILSFDEIIHSLKKELNRYSEDHLFNYWFTTPL